MTGIHQVLVEADPADPSTQAALVLRRALRRTGESEIYAVRIDDSLAGDVRPLSAYRNGVGLPFPILYHAGEGDPDVLSFLLQRYEPVVLVVSRSLRPDPLVDLDPARAQGLAFGRAQLDLLRDRVALTLAGSTAIAEDLAGLGYGPVSVVPLPVDDSLRDAPVHGPTRHHFETQLDGPLLLFVGRLHPAERLDLAVAAYHTLVTFRRSAVHFAIVGLDPSPAYSRAVEDYIWGLGLHRAWIRERPGDAELATYYRFATAFVTAGEEPEASAPGVVQALAFGLPLVGRAAGGLPETVGEAGLLLPPGSGVFLFGEALGRVVDAPALAGALAAASRRRAAAFAPGVVEAAVLRHVAEVV